MIKQEYRHTMEPLEFRADGDKLTAFGYAAKFNVYSQNLGGFVERVAPGTFAKTIKEADIRALFNHDPNYLLGRNKSGTLRLNEDETGLFYEVDLPDTQAGRDVAALLERGDISGSSFGFRTIMDEWSETEEGFPLRTLKAAALQDVSPVVYPAYTDTEVALRSLSDIKEMSYEAVQEAATQNTLQDLLRGEQELDEESDEDSRENHTIQRRKYAHLVTD